MVAIAFEPLEVQSKGGLAPAFKKSPAVERWRYTATSIQLGMALSSAGVRQLVEAELSGIQEPVARSRIREVMVEPDPVEREWFYGTPGQRYTCWTVLQDPALNFGIAYCEEGFGPRHPWGFVSLAGPQMGIGPDYCWFPTLEAALKDSPLWDESGVAE